MDKKKSAQKRIGKQEITSRKIFFKSDVKEFNKIEGSADPVEDHLVSNSLVSWWCIRLASLRVRNTELTSSVPSLEEGKRLTKDW